MSISMAEKSMPIFFLLQHRPKLTSVHFSSFLIVTSSYSSSTDTHTLLQRLLNCDCVCVVAAGCVWAWESTNKNEKKDDMRYDGCTFDNLTLCLGWLLFITCFESQNLRFLPWWWIKQAIANWIQSWKYYLFNQLVSWQRVKHNLFW